MHRVKNRSNKTQIQILIEFMSTHNMNSPKYSGSMGYKRADVKWNKLKNILKNYGPDREICQWKQTWKDLKKNARQEYSLGLLKLEEQPDSQPHLSITSRKVLDIIGYDRHSTVTTVEDVDVDDVEEKYILRVEPESDGEVEDENSTHTIDAPTSSSEVQENNTIKKIKAEGEQLLEMAQNRYTDEQDDHQHWAFSCAADLRRMSSTQQIYAKKAIAEILMEGQLGLLHRSSVKINESQITTHFIDDSANASRDSLA